LGKKVYAFPAHISLLQDFPKMGKITPDEETKAAAEIVKVLLFICS